MSSSWATPELDIRIKQLWRMNFGYQEMIQRMNIKIEPEQLRRRVYTLGLYENRNATDAQIAKMRATRLANGKQKSREFRAREL